MLSRASALRKLGAALALASMLSISLPTHIPAQEERDEIYRQWEEVGSLRARGEYDRAIAILSEVIRTRGDDEDVSRRAYSQLIFTLFKKKDEERARATAREALGRFPDLVVNTAELPPWMNETFDELRREMFGSLAIAKPEGCTIFLDEDSLGAAPLDLKYLRVGEYDLHAKKAGYHDYTEAIRIDPNGKHSFELAMERQRNKRWWLYRVAPAILAGVMAAVALTGDAGGGTEPDPLPGPPAPPE